MSNWIVTLEITVEAESRNAALDKVDKLTVGIDSVLLYDATPTDETTEPATSAARMLRAIPSEKRSQTSRENGKRGGRPRKTQE